MSQSGTTLSLSLSDPIGLGFTSSAVKVRVNGQVCAVDTSSTSVTPLTCTLATNTDGTPILVAGSISPEVLVEGVGYFKLATGVNPLTATLTATAATSTQDSYNGGYPVTITGTGFGLNKRSVTVNVCNQNAVLTSLSNIQIIFEMPKCAGAGT